MKENILDYITNNVNETTGNNIPQFPSGTTINNNVYNDLGTLLSDENVTTYFIFGNIFNELTQNTLFYGYYNDINSKSYGFIYIVDENMKKVVLITTFESGNKMFPIVAMNQDENNYMYALSKEFGDSSQARVLLFNNILSSNKAILRQSYIIPNGTNYSFQTYDNNKIKKVPEEATYYIFGRNNNNNYSSIIEFKINVGSENEWNTYNLDQVYNLGRCGVLIEKENDTVKYHLYALSQVTSPTYYVEYLLTNEQLTKQTQISLNENVSFAVSQVLAKDNQNIYISYHSLDDHKNKIVKVSNNSLEILYSYTRPNNQYIPTISLNLINNVLTALLIYVDANDDLYSKVGIIQNDTPYFTSEYEFSNVNSVWKYVIAPVNVTYNLVCFYINGDSTMTKIKLDFNPLNYNGLEYTSYNQTVPTKGRLYSSGSLVFARNIYNTTLFDSTTTSTIQIPSTLLNNITISQEDLIGATNSVLMTDNTSITKNIYETLYINFINTLSVIDEDTNTLYPNTANYINQNINIGTQQNCQNTFIGKVQINYSNDVIVQNILWTYDTDHYETSFTIDATVEVPTITFMSNDLTSIYLEKELNIQTGNYYVVSQKLRIE